jgi:hypothetical protein
MSDARQVSIRKGTAAELATVAGALGEIGYDETNKSIRSFDGATPGGFRLAKADGDTFTNGAFGNTNTVTLKDTLFTVQDDGDVTRQGRFQLSGITPGQTRVLTWPDYNGAIATLAGTETFTNKTLASPAINGGTLSSITALQAYSSDGSGTAGPVIDLFRDSASPAANDSLAEFDFNGNSSTGVKRKYGSIYGYIQSATNAAERGGLVVTGIGDGSDKPVAFFSGYTGLKLAPGSLAGRVLSFVGASSNALASETWNFLSSSNNLKLEERNAGNTVEEWDYSTGDVSIGGGRGAEAARFTRTPSQARRWEFTGSVSGAPIASTSAGGMSLRPFSGIVDLYSSDAGAGAGPVLELYRDSASPAAADLLGRIDFQGRDSAANKQQFAYIEGRIADPASGAEYTNIDAYITSNAVLRRVGGWGPNGTEFQQLASAGVWQRFFNNSGTFQGDFYYASNIARYYANSISGDVLSMNFSTGDVSLAGAPGGEALRAVRVASAVNRFNVRGSILGDAFAQIEAAGDAASISPYIVAKGSSGIDLRTGGDGAGSSGVLQARIAHVASANRRVELFGANAGNPGLTASAGHLLLAAAGGYSVMMTGIPTSSAGLPTGALWNDTGVLKIV